MLGFEIFFAITQKQDLMKMTIFFALIISIFAVSGCQTESTQTAKNALGEIKQITVTETKQAMDKRHVQFIDVRTLEEFTGGHAAGAVNIPLDTLSDKLDSLEKNEPVYVICQTGNRSRKAADLLAKAGFNNVWNVSGGTVAWQAAGLPMEPVSPHTVPSNSSKLDQKTQGALLAALNDERLAQATYQAVLNKFPGSRPFIKIIEAERKHESFLLPLFAKYGVAVPKNEFDPARISVPADLTDACKVGVKAENENIALYEGFAQFVKEPDIKEVFTQLQSASRDNHLPAFTRCSEGGAGGRRGLGRAV
jgi:rhodanese-related sulfurtransferase